MINFVLTLHAYNPYLILTAAVVAGLWGLVLFFMKKEVAPKAWYYSLYITGGLGALQALLGIILIVGGLKPGKPNDPLYYLHFVYGAIVALGLPIGITYTTNGKNPRRDILIFSIVALVVAAAGVRGLITGPNH